MRVASSSPLAPSAMTAAAVKLAVIDSGTFAAPSHRLHGERSANASASAALGRDEPVMRNARYGSAAAKLARAMLTTRATPSDRPKTAIALPSTQNGNGSPLVPLGSSVGACANDCAMVTRAKSSSET